MEHFCTLCDETFLPQGLALHASLRRHATPFTLWVLCLDGRTQAALEALALNDVRLLTLADCETEGLREARRNRSYGEYCWTLGSHLFSFVFDRSPAVQRLTYLDADVFFLGSPRAFFTELEASGKQVLITEHAFAPKYRHYAARAGRFCVQFVTVTRRPEALKLVTLWQEQTRDSCSGARSAAFFGDQQYLDEWPARYPHLVHVLAHRDRTLAPWNADYTLHESREGTVFFHFHTYRVLTARWSQWGLGYRLSEPAVLGLYAAYEAEVLAAYSRLAAQGHAAPVRPWHLDPLNALRLLRSWLTGKLRVRRHAPVPHR
ncbi:MAG: glycosyl transferase [Gemmatimonadales bacterium]